jgi:hypothetical protein
MPRTPVSVGQLIGVRVEVSDRGRLADLGKTIKELDKVHATAVRKELRRGVAEAGQGMVSAVKSAASWSSRIPGATSMQTSFGSRSAGVRVRVSATRAPHARPLEFGNKNVPQPQHLSTRHSAPPGRLLRHPVLPSRDQTRDQWVWVDMPTRPFFLAAIGARTPLIEARMRKVLDDVAEANGFTGN